MELLEDYGLKSYPMSVGRVAEALGIEVIQYSRLPKQAQESALTVSDDAFTVSTSDYATARMAVNDMRGSTTIARVSSVGMRLDTSISGMGRTRLSVKRRQTIFQDTCLRRIRSLSRDAGVFQSLMSLGLALNVRIEPCIKPLPAKKKAALGAAMSSGCSRTLRGRGGVPIVLSSAFLL